jgi:hypothetical protein
MLATVIRRDRLIEESTEHQGQRLDCLSLIEQVTFKFSTDQY